MVPCSRRSVKEESRCSVLGFIYKRHCSYTLTKNKELDTDLCSHDNLSN